MSHERRATVTLKDGRVYVADRATYVGRRLRVKGRRRVSNLSGERFYGTRELVVPLSRVKRIDWHRDSGSGLLPAPERPETSR